MGAQCSNLYDQISSNTKPRDKLLITQLNNNSLSKNQHHEQNQNHQNHRLDLKIQFIAEIQSQVIHQGQPDIVAYKKHTQSKYHIKFIDGSQYHGNLSEQGKRNNQGQQMWKDGTKLITTWIQNLPHGPGILISPNGFTFQGFWNQGIVQGYGKYYGKNGSYDGDWRDNQPHGFGVQTWSDGSTFQGHYHQGLKHGRGRYIWPDKSTYDGNWKNGQINGEGIYLYVDGRIYEGQFKDNKMQGKGVYTWPDGRKYIGSYAKDKKHGLGRYYWPDGKFFEGEWKEGKRNGYGQIVYPNGIVKQGIWENDQKREQDGQRGENMKSHIRIESTFANSEDKFNEQSRTSPTFKLLKSTADEKMLKSSHNYLKYSQYGKGNSKLPRTQHKPLYASSNSPFKELRDYYEQQQLNKEDMNERLLNRYSFIKTSMKGFNQSQLSKKGRYSSKLRRQDERKSKFFNHSSLER